MTLFIHFYKHSYKYFFSNTFISVSILSPYYLSGTVLDARNINVMILPQFHSAKVPDAFVEDTQRAIECLFSPSLFHVTLTALHPYPLKRKKTKKERLKVKMMPGGPNLFLYVLYTSPPHSLR